MKVKRYKIVLVIILSILIYNFLICNTKTKIYKLYNLPSDIGLHNFMVEKYEEKFRLFKKAYYAKLFLQYKNIVDKNKSDVTERAVQEYRIMFGDDSTIGKYQVDKKDFCELYENLANLNIQNNPKAHKVYEVKKLQLEDCNRQCRRRPYYGTCLKFHEEILELNKKICINGGSCDIGSCDELDFYIMTHFNKKEDVEKFYDELEEFFMTLNINDKRVAKGLIRILIEQYYFISEYSDLSVNLSEYYKTRKEKIDNKIKKAVELDKKLKVLDEDIGASRYKYIIRTYENFNAPEMVEHYKKIFNETFITSEVIKDNYSKPEIRYTRREQKPDN